jgi:hypothetical protein
MSMANRDNLYRILDANFNRAKEGLRVCEDICRYSWDEKTLTRQFKDVRHELTAAIEALGMLKALAHRSIQTDVGKATTAQESSRRDLSAVFWANSQRVKESLRVLEEVAKLIKPSDAQKVKELRYKVYALEQKAFKGR